MKIASNGSRVFPNGLKDGRTYRNDDAICRLSQCYGSAYNLSQILCQIW